MSPKIGTRSFGKRSVSSISAAIGAISFSAILRTASRKSCWSSVRYMMVLPFRALALGPGKLRLQDAGAIDSLSQKTQLGIIRRARHRCRCIADKVEAGIVPDFLQRDQIGSAHVITP